MNGKKARAIRKKIYKNRDFKDRKYSLIQRIIGLKNKDGAVKRTQIVSETDRRQYQKAKIINR